jgi:hypothetical protein
MGLARHVIIRSSAAESIGCKNKPNKKQRPMKTITKLALTSLATAMFATGSAFANDTEWATFNHLHGSVTYIRPVQKEATVAVYAHGKTVRSANSTAQRGEVRLNQITTAHGPVSYFAPVE